MLSNSNPAVRHCPAVRREPHRRPRDEGEAEGDAPEEEPALRGADDRERRSEVEQVASHEGVFCGQNLILFVARTQRKAHKIHDVPLPPSAQVGFLNIQQTFSCLLHSTAILVNLLDSIIIGNCF